MGFLWKEKTAKPRLFMVSESRRINRNPVADKELRRILYSFTNAEYESVFESSGFPPDDGVRKYLPNECNDKLAFHIDRLYERAGKHRRWVQDSTKADSFFENLDGYINALEKLKCLEPYNAFYKPTPSQQFAELIQNISEIEIAFLDRSWAAVLSASTKLKTEVAKNRLVDKYFASLDCYADRFSPAAAQKINDLKGSQIKWDAIIIPEEERVPIDIEKERELLTKYRNARSATERHFSRIPLFTFYYKYRHDTEALEKCIFYCKEDIAELGELDKEEAKNRLRAYDRSFFVGAIKAFDRLIAIYEDQGDFETAKKYAALAIEHAESHEMNAESYHKKFERIEKKIQKLKEHV